jgi:hypothetical protein
MLKPILLATKTYVFACQKVLFQGVSENKKDLQEVTIKHKYLIFNDIYNHSIFAILRPKRQSKHSTRSILG